jgi:hypothetical protein
MVRKKTEPNRLDDRLDDLLADCQGPEDILGKSGLLKQLRPSQQAGRLRRAGGDGGGDEKPPRSLDWPGGSGECAPDRYRAYTIGMAGSSLALPPPSLPSMPSSPSSPLH